MRDASRVAGTGSREAQWIVEDANVAAPRQRWKLARLGPIASMSQDGARLVAA
jgi:hypothetical protein